MNSVWRLFINEAIIILCSRHELHEFICRPSHSYSSQGRKLLILVVILFYFLLEKDIIIIYYDRSSFLLSLYEII